MLEDYSVKIKQLVVNERAPCFAIDEVKMQQLMELLGVKRLQGNNEVTCTPPPPDKTHDQVIAEESWLALNLSVNDYASSSSSSSEALFNLCASQESTASSNGSNHSQSSTSVRRKLVIPPSSEVQANIHRLRMEWDSLNGDQRLAVIKCTSALDYALIKGIVHGVRCIHMKACV
jgi:hypothetical protein